MFLQSILVFTVGYAGSPVGKKAHISTTEILLQVVVYNIACCWVEGRDTKSWMPFGDIANNFLWFDLSQWLYSRYHDIQKIGRGQVIKICMIFFVWNWEGNILFNAALNTFYLLLYGVRHMVKDHSNSERGNPVPPHGLLFPISSKGSFICIISQTW